MRIVVTGATGFVGRSVIRAALAAGVEVTAVHHSNRITPADPRIRWVKADLLAFQRPSRIFSPTAGTALIHTAWYTGPRYADHEENRRWARATRALFEEFLDRGGRRIVSVGTCAEYAPTEAPCEEFKTPIDPSTVYGETKAEVALLVDSLVSRENASACHARPFFLYGPGEPPTKLISHLISRLSNFERAATGPGASIRDFLHIQDAGRALVALAGSELLGPINLASGIDTRIDDLAHRVATHCGSPDLLDIGGLPADPWLAPRMTADVSRQTHELGYHPAIDLESGIREMEEAFRSNLSPRRTREEPSVQAHRSS